MFCAECKCKRFSVRRTEMKKSWRWRKCKSCNSKLVVTHDTMGFVCDNNERTRDNLNKKQISKKRVNKKQEELLKKCLQTVTSIEQMNPKNDVFMGVNWLPNTNRTPYNTPVNESLESQEWFGDFSIFEWNWLCDCKFCDN